ncbi:MAG: DNA polymerase III subunit delta [Phycisphaerales bacterium]
MAKRSSSKASARAPTADDAVVALVGREIFLRTEHTAALKRALEEAHGQVDVVRFDGESASAAEVLDECRSFGLLAGHKMVVVDEADQILLAEARPLFERYCEAPCEGATLVLRTEKWNKGKLDKLIDAVGAIVRCDGVDEAKAVAWAGRRCAQKHGRAIDGDAARLLISKLGTDLGRIDAELAKLAAGVPEKLPVTRDHVVELVGQTREEELWSVQAEILSGDCERAIGYVRRLLDGAPRDAAVPVTYACVDLARKLAGLSAAKAQGRDARSAAKELKIWGPGQQEIMRVVGRMSPADARRLLARAVDADAAQKSGLGRPDRVLERLALTMTRACAGPRG